MYVARVRRTMTDGDGEDNRKEDTYDDMDDGAGCAEIWEKLSRKRREDRLSDD
jgi:hypothetical protein